MEPPDGPSRAASAPAADAPVRAQAARPRRATPRTDGPHGTARATGRFGEAESPGAKPFPIAGGTARGPGGRDGIARRRERRPPARGRATGARETARSAGSARGPAIGNRVSGAVQGRDEAREPDAPSAHERHAMFAVGAAFC